MKKILLLLFIFCTTFAFANIGKITTLKGAVEIHRAGNLLQNIKTGDIIEKDDTIQTLKDGKLQIQFKDNTIITLGKDSKLNVSEFLLDDVAPKANFNVLKGAFKVITGKIGKINPSKFKIKTRSAAIGIRGTITLGNTQPQGDTIACTQGRIVVQNEFGSVEVPAGQVTQVLPNTPPPPPVPLTATQQQKLESDSGGDLQTQTDEPKTGNKKEKKKQKQEEQTTEKKDKKEKVAAALQDGDLSEEEVKDLTGADVEKVETITDPDGKLVNFVVTVFDEMVDLFKKIDDVKIDEDGGVTIIGSGTGSDTGKTMDYTDYLHTASFMFQYNTTDSGVTKNYLDGVSAYSFYEKSNGADSGYFSIARGLLSGTDTVDRYFANSVINTVKDARPLTYVNFDLSSYTPTDTYSGFMLASSGTMNLGDITDSATGETFNLDGLSVKTYSDDMLEFIVQKYSKENIEITTTNNEIKTQNYFDYDGYLILGKATSYSSAYSEYHIPTSGWSIYGEPSSSLDVGQSGFATLPFTVPSNHNDYYTTGGTLFNWTNHNALDFTIGPDGIFIVIGTVEDDGGKAKLSADTMEFPIEFNYGSSSATSTYDQDHYTGKVEGYLYGTYYQGLGVNHTMTTDSYTATEAYAAYRNTAYGSTTTPSGMMNYSGYSTSIKAMAEYNDQVYYSTSCGLGAQITINRDSGKFTTDSLQTYLAYDSSSNTRVNLTDTSNTAYITDDTFAVTGLTGTTNYSDIGTNSYLVAIDTDPKETTDDEMSWGYWGAEIDKTNVILPSTWLVGNPAYIDTGVIKTVNDLKTAWEGSTSATFTGNVIGSYINGTTINDIHAITMNDNNLIQLGMSISNSTITLDGNSKITFDYSGGSASYSLSGVEATIQPENGLPYSASQNINNTTINLNGKFYGNKANGTGGTFSIQDGSNTAIGSFKATKQP